MTIAGDLHTMASALGQPVTDDRVLRAMTLVGEDYLQLQYRGDRIEVVVAAIGERD